MNFHKLHSVPTDIDANAVKLESNLLRLSSQLKRPYNWSSSGTSVLDQEQSSADDANLCSSSICEAPIIRQFWKAGVYNDELTPKSTTQSGSTYLHIHPRFLHSNATSHKWVFGAVAELIDNAVDEPRLLVCVVLFYVCSEIRSLYTDQLKQIQNGATFVHIDKTLNPRNGSSALLIQDDGNGMDPEAMRRCLSFGFSDKSSISAIGKYGNGFKTSSMRLGADVIVFSRNINDRTMTQSIGLLSYTFLTREGYDRIVVPMVHYQFNVITGSFDSLQLKANENSNLNMSMLLQWSPYSTEEELLKQFEDVGSHGTKVIVYNLWLDEDRNMELDFESDPEVFTGSFFISCIDMETRLYAVCRGGKTGGGSGGSEQAVQWDICITRDAHEKIKGSRQATSEHIANRLRYSLRAYLSILYLKLPETFAMVLRGKVVIYHNVATDLKFTEFVMYKPFEGSVVTTIGFLKEAPHVNVHGFNVYHKNRLILPFFSVVRFSRSRGRGVVGVLEANFIEPTHDKQDFENTSIFQKLVQRLKEMTWEYWDYHCGLIGYQFTKKDRPPSATSFIYQNGTEQPVPRRKHFSRCDTTRKPPPMIASINSKAAYQSISLPKPVTPSVPPSFPPGFQQGSRPLLKPVEPSFIPVFQEGSRPLLKPVEPSFIPVFQEGSRPLLKPVEPSFIPVFQEGSRPLPKPVEPSFIPVFQEGSRSLPKPVEPSFIPVFQEGSNLKRKSSDQPTTFKPVARMAVDSINRFNPPGLANSNEAKNVMEENRKLRSQCSEFEKAEEQLKLKVMRLKMELGVAQQEFARVLAEFQYSEKVKGETNFPCI